MLPFRWLGIELVEVSLIEKLVAALGSVCSIFATLWLTGYCFPMGESSGVVASMGASAVLLYAVPHGQLSQPWPLIGGHVISATIGVCCAIYIQESMLATALAVGISIGAMHQLKCIHPPGGATAFTAVMGGSAIDELGFSYVLCPVLANVLMMLALAIVINLPFPWRRYPAVLSRPLASKNVSSSLGIEPSHQEVLAAVRSLNSFVDVSEEDLVHLAKLIARSPEPSTSSLSNNLTDTNRHHTVR